MLVPQKDLIRSKKGADCDHMTEEQVPFKSIKITLSEEALMLLEELKTAGSFRSNSMTIEESIRAFHYIVAQVRWATGRAKNGKPIPEQIRITLARDIGVRLARFMPPIAKASEK
jgi:hypothetical protein